MGLIKKLKNQEKIAKEEPKEYFIITYGWAIAIILIAIAAPVLIGLEKSGDLVFERCSIPRSSGLSCKGFNVTSTGIELLIKNRLNDTLTLKQVSEIIGTNNSCKISSDISLQPEGNASLIFNTDGSIGSCLALISADKKIKADIVLELSDSNNTLNNATGTFVART